MAEGTSTARPMTLPAPLPAAAQAPTSWRRRWAARGWVWLGWIPVTGRSLLLVGAAVAAFLLYARAHQDLVLLVVSLVGFAVTGLAVLSVVGLALSVRLRWRPRGLASVVVHGPEGPAQAAAAPPPRLRLEAGQPCPTGFCGPGAGWLPLVRVRWEWGTPGPAQVRLRPQGFGLQEEILLQRRGLVDEVVREIIVEDLLGLARLRWSNRAHLPLLALPRNCPARLVLTAGPVTGDGVSHPDGRPEGDPVELRRYAPGDPLRNVVWKVFARTRRLMVRTPERAVVPTHRTLAYLIAGSGDEPVAGVARTALESGLFGARWTFGADGSPGDASTLPEALTILARSGSAALVEQEGAGLDRFLDAAGPDRASRLILFSPVAGLQWLDRVLRVRQLHPLPLTVVLGVETLRSATGAWPNELGLAVTGRERWSRLWLRPPRPEEATPLATLQGLIARLNEHRLEWLVAERETGRTFRAAQFLPAGAGR